MSGIDAIKTGEASELAGEFLDASAAYQSALTDADPLVVADARFHLGRVSWRQGRYDEAVTHYDAARIVTMQLGANNLRARVENGLGVVHHARGAYAQARASYAVALDMTSDPVQRGRVMLNLGAIANIEGDLESARLHYARSRALFQESGYRRGEALALHNIGMLHADQQSWDEAEEAYRRCLELLEQEGDRQMIANVLLNRSEVSCARTRYDEAIANCDLALSIYSEIGDEVGRGEALRWKGHALWHLPRFEEADRAISDAIRIAHRTQVKLLEAEASRDLGASRAAQRNWSGARKALTRALVLFEELGAQREVADVRAELGQLGS